MKNIYNGFSDNKEKKTYYVSLKGETNTDYKIETEADGKVIITEVASGKAVTFTAKDFDFQYGALLRFSINGQNSLIQFIDAKDNLHFNFYYKGNTLTATVLDE